MNNVIVLIIATIALSVSVASFIQGYAGRFQISTDGGFIYRLDTTSGHISAYHLYPKQEPDSQQFLAKFAETPQ